MTTVVQVSFGIPLRQYAGGDRGMVAAGQTVSEVLTVVAQAYPRLGERLLQPDGRPRSEVACFLNDEDIRELAGLATPVAAGDQLLLMPAVAGG